jgi:hypothetical protein
MSGDERFPPQSAIFLCYTEFIGSFVINLLSGGIDFIPLITTNNRLSNPTKTENENRTSAYDERLKQNHSDAFWATKTR